MQEVYRRGDHGTAVAEIRGRLVLLGLLPQRPATMYSPEADETFDDGLDRAVRQFQQERGATVDGAVGPATWRLLDDARWALGDRVLQHVVGQPLTGDDVAALQQRLLDMGFDCGRVDGILGRRTDQALREFQANVGLVDDGTCGPHTFKALDQLSRTVTGGAPHALRETETIRNSGPTLAGKVIVIDPGHGGGDLGAVAGDLNESEVAADLAARIEGRLSTMGVTAYLTRGRPAADDRGPTESERAAFANQTDADLLISLHCDTSTDPAACGVASYYYGVGGGAHSAVGEEFAALVQREIVARTDLLNCRTHGKTWDILRRTRMPAVRLELGYLTNAGDAARLSDPAFRDTVAEAVAVAVQRLYLAPDDDHPTGVLRLPELVG